MSIRTEGIPEFRAATRRAAQRLEQGLRATAQRTATKVQAGAQDRVRVRTGAQRAAIRVIEGKDSVRVEAHAAPGRDPLLPLWLEHGTSKMPPQPYMEPAIREAEGSYHQDGERANDAAIGELR